MKLKCASTFQTVDRVREYDNRVLLHWLVIVYLMAVWSATDYSAILSAVSFSDASAFFLTNIALNISLTSGPQ